MNITYPSHETIEKYIPFSLWKSELIHKFVAQHIITLDDTIFWGYHLSVIKIFKCKETEKIFLGHFSNKLPQSIQRIAERKLIMLHRAGNLTDLRVPPANHLEALKGKSQGQHSIRINDQWRICFEWHKDGVYNVEINDYH
jgi:proteic killer suppression protein